MRRFFGLLAFSSALCLLSGCGAGFSDPAVPVLGAVPDSLQGRAMGGQQPIVGAIVSVYEVGSSGYGAGAIMKAQTATTSGGAFSFSASAYTCTASNSPMYIVVTGGNPGLAQGTNNTSSTLIAALGPCSAAKTQSVVIDEVTTAATVEALGQFMGTTLGSSGNAYEIGGTCSGCATGIYNRGLVHAMNYTYPQLVNNAFGTAVPSHINGSIVVTTESAKVNTIANILASCVNSTGSTSTSETTTPCGKLFNAVGVNGAAVSGTRASDTLQAALQMQLYPYYNVSTVYGYQSSTPPFTGLSTIPNDWTVGISYASSSFGLGIQQNTSSNLDIDAGGSVYFPTNKSGAAGIAIFNPASATFTGPLVSGVAQYPQYVAIDRSSSPYAWVTDMDSNYLIGVNTTTLSGGLAYVGSGYSTSGPVTVDAGNNVVFAANISSAHLVYTLPSSRSGIMQAYSSGAGANYSLAGTPNGLTVAESVPYTNGYIFAGDTSSACDLEFSPGTSADDSVSTGSSTCVVGGVLSTMFGYYTGYSTTSTNAICYIDGFMGVQDCPTYTTLNNAKGFAADGAGHFWVANAGNASISTFSVSSSCYTSYCNAVAVGGSSATAYLHGSSNGGTATVPFGIGVDGSGNVWVSNASCVSTSSTPCSANNFTLTEVIGVATPAITPVSAQDSSSPSFGSRPSN